MVLSSLADTMYSPLCRIFRHEMVPLCFRIILVMLPSEIFQIRIDLRESTPEAESL